MYPETFMYYRKFNNLNNNKFLNTPISVIHFNVAKTVKGNFVQGTFAPDQVLTVMAIYKGKNPNMRLPWIV